MDDMQRQSIRETYQALVSGSLLERRDRLVLAGMPLIESLAKDFFHTYPSSNYTIDELQGESSLALVEASASAADGRDIGSDIVAYLSGAIWKKLLTLRDESPPIGPAERTTQKLRKQKKKATTPVVSIHDEYGKEVDVATESSHQKVSDLFDELLEGCCKDLLDRTIVVYRSQGHSNEAIARFTGFSQATVSRRLSEIESRHDALALGA